MRWLKVSTAVGLVLVGVLGLVGCIWIPGSYQRVDDQPRPETQIGAAGSDKPLRVSEATRAYVYRVLGPPTFESNDRRHVVYEYDVNNGLWLLCFVIPQPTQARRYLRLNFDEAGKLESYRVFKDADEAGEGRFDAPAPSTPGAQHG